MPALLRIVLTATLAILLIPACASLQSRDPLQVTVAGIEPLQGQGLELRMNVRLRVQNPNDSPVDYDGEAVEMGACRERLSPPAWPTSPAAFRASASRSSPCR
jgi:hypothetical protein